MKKILLITLVLLAFSIFFTACGGSDEMHPKPGLYDDNDNLLASWDELVNTYGMKADVDYESNTCMTDPTSPYCVLTSTDALQNGTKLVIGSIDRIGEFAFIKCINLTGITIPNSVTEIGFLAFRGCTSLTSITIPNSVTEIGFAAFRGCTSLTSILVDKNNPDYSSDGIALYNKDKSSLLQVPAGITSFTIPNSVTEIGESAFEGCTSLTSITIPNSVTEIGVNAFCGCTSLTSITIPDSVTTIGYSAFCGCTSLTSILVDKNNLDYSSDGIALYNKDKSSLLQVPAGIPSFTIPGSVSSIDLVAFYGCEKLTSITIPNSVTEIGVNAFYGCTSLTSITIPNSVTEIGVSAFLGCTSLTSILVDKNNPDYSSDGIALYNKNKSSLLRVPGSVTSFIVPDSVTEIGDYAFEGCTSLTSITIPNSVTCINGATFYDCTSLTDITFTGSKEQWYEVSKEINWNYNVPATEVVCTDGTVTIG